MLVSNTIVNQINIVCIQVFKVFMFIFIFQINSHINEYVPLEILKLHLSHYLK